MKIYVNSNAAQNGNGTKEAPFQTLSQAAEMARAGDEVLVAPGIYREWVDPKNGGMDEEHRIVYRSLEPGKAVITGAEPVKTWQPYEGEVWTARIPNSLFGGSNPYTTLLEGDWYIPE